METRLDDGGIVTGLSFPHLSLLLLLCLALPFAPAPRRGPSLSVQPPSPVRGGICGAAQEVLAGTEFSSAVLHPGRHYVLGSRGRSDPSVVLLSPSARGFPSS